MGHKSKRRLGLLVEISSEDRLKGIKMTVDLHCLADVCMIPVCRGQL